MQTLDIIIRIVIATVIGGIIGYEREKKNKPAGFTTHTLACVSACIVSLIQVKMVEDVSVMIIQNPILANSLKADIGRVIAQVITGVGFLGAGTIILNNGNVEGLTTATTLWAVACMGLAIGLGYLKIAIISVIFIILIVGFLGRLEEKIFK